MKSAEKFGNIPFVMIDISDEVNPTEVAKYIEENHVEAIWVNSKRIEDILWNTVPNTVEFRRAKEMYQTIETDLSFLKGIKNKSKIKKIHIFANLIFNVAFEIIKEFENVEELYFVNQNRPCYRIEISQFKQLKKLSISGDIDIIGLEKISLKELSVSNNKKLKIANYGSTIESLDFRDVIPLKLDRLGTLTNLKKLILIQTDIETLESTEGLRKIEYLEVNYCHKLSSLNGIQNLEKLKFAEICYCHKLRDISAIVNCADLTNLRLENCKHIDNFCVLSALKKLQLLSIFDCGKIASLSFVKEMNCLKYLNFYYTDILDGDLTPCLKLENVITADKRHYNIKAKDLPRK